MFSIIDIANSKKRVHSVLTDINSVTRQEFEEVKDTISTVKINDINQETVNFIEENGMIVNISDGVNEYIVSDITGLATKEELDNKVNINGSIVDVNFTEREDGAIYLINEKRIGCDTEHITTSTGITQEEEYIGLLKSTSKEFSTTNGILNVSNVIGKQKLSTNMKGYTVKNLFDLNKVSQVNSSSYSLIKDDTNGFIITKFANKYYAEIRQVDQCIRVKPGTTYTLIWDYDILEQTNVDANVSRITVGYCTNTTGSYVGEAVVDSNTYVSLSKKIYTFTTRSDLADNYGFSIRALRSPTGDNATDEKIRLRIIGLFEGTVTTVSEYVPFGLHSTKAILNVNSTKYPFYKNEEDKENGKVVILDSVDGTSNNLQMMEDGSGVLTEHYKKIVLSDISGWGKSALSNSEFCIFWVGGLGAKSRGNVICDQFTFRTNQYGEQVATEEGIAIIGDSSLHIGIAASKLSTQDVNGFNIWLQENPDPVTAIYQLDTPIVTPIPKSLIPVIPTAEIGRAHV